MQSLNRLVASFTKRGKIILKVHLNEYSNGKSKEMQRQGRNDRCLSCQIWKLLTDLTVIDIELKLVKEEKGGVARYGSFL